MKERVIALAGNPNVGKSSVFNILTGLHQHTGNWSGKTVDNTYGYYEHNDNRYKIYDLPGTYSIFSHSEEEKNARDFLCFEKYDVVVIVCDSVCLMRNLNLVLQICEITDNVVVCVNMIDEAYKKKIKIDLNKLSDVLNVEVVGTSARKNIGIDSLKDAIERTIHKKNKSRKVNYGNYIENTISEIEKKLPVEIGLSKRFAAINLLCNNLDLIKDKIDLKDEKLRKTLFISRQMLKSKGLDSSTLDEYIATTINNESENIYNQTVKINNKDYNKRDRKIDKILTNKITGIPIMILLFAFIFWLTIVGSNYPSNILQKLLFGFEDILYGFMINIKIPIIICDMISHGMYRVLAWIVSVMLPPMAIFFPLFTFLEDIGYLPRIAFNVDSVFKKCNTCGKQALTMAMGFGCNSVGVSGCKIIDSPRERLISILTNSFVPCNGRFPILISIISMFFIDKNRGVLSSIKSVFILVLIILLGIFMTFLVSKLLSKTILKGIPSSFTLELPPYRKPQIGKIIVRSIFDRTIFVLVRAISVAMPAGIIIWLLSNITIGNNTVLLSISNFLNPVAKLIGMDGTILLAFILGFPANEIVIPIIIMGYMSSGKLVEISNLNTLKELFISNGWNSITAISVMIFSLLHWPCSTTCLTIKKETKSIKWTLLSILLPTLCGIVICAIINIFNYI